MRMCARTLAAELMCQKLPSSVLVDSDEHTYTIYDGYPKGTCEGASANLR